MFSHLMYQRHFVPNRRILKIHPIGKYLVVFQAMHTDFQGHPNKLIDRSRPCQIEPCRRGATSTSEISITESCEQSCCAFRNVVVETRKPQKRVDTWALRLYKVFRNHAIA